VSPEPELEPEAQKRLDDLVAGFEEDMRQRPTPMELGEEEGGDTRPPAARRKRPTKAKPAAAEIAAQAELAAKAPAQPPAKAPAQPSAEAPNAPEPAPVDTVFPALSPRPEAAPLPYGDIQSWWSRGERIPVEVTGPSNAAVTREIFVRVVGDGPWLTLVHGFPTSSYDWAPMMEPLSKKYRLLMFDLLGFGDSDKPSGHDWSAFEQADIVESLWRHHRVDSTRILAHDVGDTVTLELLARSGEGKLAAKVSGITFLNGGIYTGFHRPRPIQVWLQRPVIGALIARMLSESRFGPALAEIFGPEHQPTPAELHQHWLSVARRNGGRNYHRLIRYIPERRANAVRWETALEATDIPLRFVWGMADPVSGAHMAEVIRERRQGANMIELADVGHYPQLEAPEQVARAVLS
jgi:pimeloyl-ACP methyl ester carboxylesterase